MRQCQQMAEPTGFSQMEQTEPSSLATGSCLNNTPASNKWLPSLSFFLLEVFMLPHFNLQLPAVRAPVGVSLGE